MADVVTEQPAPLARREPEPSVSRRRFAAAYLALAAIVGAAVGLAIVFTTDHSDTTAGNPIAGRAWSSWAPASTGTLGVREIARHVAPTYRQTNDRQLVGVTAGPMQIRAEQGPVPVTALLISSGIAGRTRERVDVAFPAAGVFFAQCGRIAECQPSAKPTVGEELLLLRQALELSLYTFRYLPETDAVVVFLPPAPGVDQTDPAYHRAVYLPRAAVSTELEIPLKATIPTVEGGISSNSFSRRDADHVLGIVAGHLFHYAYQQAPDSSVFMTLTPIEP